MKKSITLVLAALMMLSLTACGGGSKDKGGALPGIDMKSTDTQTVTSDRATLEVLNETFFTYLGGLNEKIHTPRLTQPRVKIPGGSVGIAGSQTGVYPIDSPGGWQLIGRTPVKLYDPNRAEPILPRAGQYIKFRAVDQAEFDEISRQVEAGTYQCVSYPRKEAE